jgi:hypothetical protein
MNVVQRRIRFSPLPGESLTSLIIRAAGAVAPVPWGTVQSLMGNPHHLASAVTRRDLLDEFAEYLNISPQAVASAMIVPSPDEPGCVRLNDFLFRPDQLVLTPVRIASDKCDVAALGEPYHRLVWTVRDIRVDPVSGAPLVDRCGFCSAAFAWATMAEIGRCGSCGAYARRSQAPDTPQDALGTFRSALLRTSIDERRAARGTLPPSIRAWPEADLFSLLDALNDMRPAEASSEYVLSALRQGSTGMLGLLSLRLAQLQRGGGLSDLIAFARLASEINISRSRRVRECFQLLLGLYEPGATWKDRKTVDDRSRAELECS